MTGAELIQHRTHARVAAWLVWERRAARVGHDVFMRRMARRLEITPREIMRLRHPGAAPGSRVKAAIARESARWPRGPIAESEWPREKQLRLGRVV